MFLHFFTYFSSHKVPIVKNIRVICEGLRHFLNLFKRNNVKLSNISILFVCYVKGDNNNSFWNLFTPCLCLWMNLLCLDVHIWYEVKVKVFFVTDSNSLSITYIEFKSSFLYFLWIFLEMAIAHYWFTSCVNRLKFVQKYTCNCTIITDINIIVNNYHDQNMMKYKLVIIFYLH